MTVTQKLVRQIFIYNQKTGIVRARVYRKGNSKKAGSAYDKHAIRIYGRSYLIHRLIWLYVYGYLPKEIDHKNGNHSDNRICNLREATHEENIRNQKRRIDNRTGFKGVKPVNNRFRARIGKVHLGYFATPESAHEAYVQAAKEIFGEFARAN